MSFKTAVNLTTKKLLNSKKARTAKGGMVEIREVLNEYNGGKVEMVLECTTWGYDYAEYAIPNDRAECVSQKIFLQFIQKRSILQEVMLRYYLDIMRRADK